MHKLELIFCCTQQKKIQTVCCIVIRNLTQWMYMYVYTCMSSVCVDALVYFVLVWRKHWVLFFFFTGDIPLYYCWQNHHVWHKPLAGSSLLLPVRGWQNGPGRCTVLVCITAGMCMCLFLMNCSPFMYIYMHGEDCLDEFAGTHSWCFWASEYYLFCFLSAVSDHAVDVTPDRQAVTW